MEENREEKMQTPPDLVGEKSIARDMCFVGTPAGGNTCMVDVKDGKVLRIRPLRYFERYTRDEVKPWVIRIRVGCRLKRAVAKDQVITYDDVELPQGRLIDELRARQARHFGQAGGSAPGQARGAAPAEVRA